MAKWSFLPVEHLETLPYEPKPHNPGMFAAVEKGLEEYRDRVKHEEEFNAAIRSFRHDPNRFNLGVLLDRIQNKFDRIEATDHIFEILSPKRARDSPFVWTTLKDLTDELVELTQRNTL